MKKIFTAATVEEAKKLACEEFQKEESKIIFNVIEEPKKGIFGKIKGEAKIEAEYEITKTDIAVKYIKDVLNVMGIENVSFSISELENGCLIDINGDGMDEVLGKKGDILDSLQYLSSLVCNKIDRELTVIISEKKEKNSLNSLQLKLQTA